MVSLNKLPGVAQPAIQEGKYVGKVIKARLAARHTRSPFKYFDKGSMATIGYRSAVADAFGVSVTGFLAYLMWAFIHVLYLVGWGNRLGTLYTWARALVVRAQPRPTGSSPSTRRGRLPPWPEQSGPLRSSPPPRPRRSRPRCRRPPRATGRADP